MVCHLRVALITGLFYFDHLDIRSFTETFKFTRRLAHQEPLKSYLVGKSLPSFSFLFSPYVTVLTHLLEGEISPGSSVQTDEQIIGEQNPNGLISRTLITSGLV